jgi:predicted CXXCH cytochrome family protein
LWIRLGGAVAAAVLLSSAGRLLAAPAPSEGAPTAIATTAPAGKGAKDRTLRDYSPDCLRAGCHGELNSTPWVHGPVAIGSCDVCHRALPQGEHTYELTRTKENVCTYCHRMASGKFTHQVVTDTGCTKCHNPHGGAKRNLLVTQDVGKLCGECHDPTRPLPVTADGKPRKASANQDRQDLPKFAALHEPVAKGDCLTCHETHNADYEGLLLKEQRTLCLACHEKVGKTLVGAPRLHKPVTEKCTACHVAHGGNVKRLLTQEPKALCLSCHKPVADSLATGFVVPAAASTAAAGAAPPPAAPGEAPTPAAETQPATAAGAVAPAETRLRLHAAIRDAETCLVCHEAHASAGKGLTHSPLDQACYTCHDKEIRLPTSDRVIPDVKSELAKAQFQHKPVHDGRCAECHMGHASPHSQLLSQAFPIGLYVPFAEATYALCFACHDLRLATEGHTVRTGFRDGDQNLHYVHIMDEDPAATRAAEAAQAAPPAPGESLKKPKPRKGRSCGLCHEPHSSMQAKQIRESIQYGPEGWKLAIRFEQTATGGTCTTACHKTKSYSNQQPPAPPKEPIPAKP